MVMTQVIAASNPINTKVVLKYSGTQTASAHLSDKMKSSSVA